MIGDCQPCWIVWFPGITIAVVRDAIATISQKLADSHDYLLFEHAVYFN